MLSEINYLLFNGVVLVSFVACAVYFVFFFSQREELRKIARMILIGSGILQTLYIISRYIIAGHTPITSQHEAVVFFAWSVTWAYLSFHWRYSVKNFGTFVSTLVLIMLLIAASVSRDFFELTPALQSFWLPVHAGVAVMAYGFLALAF
ncbi:MAG: c-type cytochrome biogenesis protein CcsB, partial [Desulfocapsa sp.]|nr:c-type cytochrome biogenesis protein CcsB [Desulfocapsa sp.]